MTERFIVGIKTHEKNNGEKQSLPFHLHLAESLNKAATCANTRELLFDEELFALEDTERSLRSDQIVTLEWPYEFEEAIERFWSEGLPFNTYLRDKEEYFRGLPGRP